MGNARVKYAVFDGGTVVSDGRSEEFDEAVIDRILAAHPGITQAIVATRAVRSMTPSRWCVAASGAVCGSHRNFLFPFVTVTLRPKLWVRTVLRLRRRCVALPGPQSVDRGFRDGHYHRSGFCRRGFPGAVIFLPAYRCASGPCTIIRRRFPCVNPVRTRRFWGVRPSRRSGRA